MRVVLLCACLMGCAAAAAQEGDGMAEDQSRRWGSRYDFAADGVGEVSRQLDISQIAQPSELDPISPRDWVVFVLPEQGENPTYATENDGARAVIDMVLRVGAGTASSEVVIPVPSYGLAKHISAGNLSVFLRSNGGPLDGILTQFNRLRGSFWITPGVSLCRWQTTFASPLVLAVPDFVEVPSFATGRFRVEVEPDASSVSVVAFNGSPGGTLNIGTIVGAANFGANAAAGAVASYHVPPGANLISLTMNAGAGTPMATVAWEVCG